MQTRMLALGVSLAGVLSTGAAQSATTPFKLGTFQRGDRVFVGLVLDDARVFDISTANAAFQAGHPKSPRVVMPADMKGVIERYDKGVGERLRELADAGVGTKRAPYAFPLSSLKILPPVRSEVILNAGANYPEHLAGIQAQGGGGGGSEGADAPRQTSPAGARAIGPAKPAQSAPGIWERSPGDTRPDNPYFFLKSPSVVVGADDDVVIPQGRKNIDWECEFAVVIGRTAHHVPVKSAADYIFGYTIEFDVSDRGGRGDRKMGGGPDWLVQKNHDTFGPVGPFIVPKEFFKDPMHTRHYFELNGVLKQDSNTDRMEYNIWDGIAYGSNVMTLHPGDMLSMGTPPGTNIDRPDARWMQAGDKGVCTVEGIGSQHHRIVAEEPSLK